MQQVWIGAQLTAYAPRKSNEFPKLDKLLHKPTSSARTRQTPEQQLGALRAIMANRKR